MTRRKIYFRADASIVIGYGHFIRTLALADMLKDDFDCTFFTSSPSAYQIAEMNKVCNHIVLNEKTKLTDFINLLDGGEIVVLDNYFYTTDYQKQIKVKGCKLVCIDDMHDKYYYADVIINHGVVDELDYLTEPYTRLCLGFEWLLLRAPFIQRIENKNNSVRYNKIVFAFGGSDILGLSYKVAKILEELKIASIGIIGDGYAMKDVEKYKYVNFVTRVSADELADIFSTSEYAILPASTMSLEAISCGTKLIMGYFVDNQKSFSEYMALNGYSCNLGDMTKPDFEDHLRSLLCEITLSSTYKEQVILPNGIKNRVVNLFSTL